MKVALVCIAKNEDNYIHEWIDYHLKLGFDDVFIFKNNWNFEIDKPNVTSLKFDGNVKQLQAYNFFLSNYEGQYDWAAFFDVDEFLVLKKHKTIKDFIGEFENTSAISVNWVLFGSNGHNKIVNNNYNVLERFTKRSSNVDQHIKTICKVNKEIKFNTPHSTNKQWTSPNFERGFGSFNKNGDDSIAQLNHYFSKTIEEFKSKIARGRADTTTYRRLDEYKHYDINEVEDLHALNFYKETK